MKFKMAVLAVFLSTPILFAQEKTKISVFPFQNKSDRQHDWLTYGLSYLINESMNSSGAFEGVSQDQIHKATSDPDINFLSALDGKPTPVFAKYQSNWNANIFIVGNFTATADTLTVYGRVCNLPQSICSSPVTVKGDFRDYRGFYLLMTRLIESLYTEIKTYSSPLTQTALANSQDKTRLLCGDYEGYKNFIKSWTAIRYYEDGLSASHMSKFDDAIRFFESAQALDQSNVLSISSNLSKVYVLRGNLFYQESKWDDAAKDYSTAITLDPKNSEALYNLGNVYKAKNDYENALQNYKQSLDMDPANFDACLNIGYVFMEQGKSLDAALAYEKALGINEKNALAHYYAGVAYDNNSEIEKAVTHYHRAIELDNSVAGAHLNLGILLKQRKDLSGARKEYEQAVALDPNNASAHRNLGILLMNDKKEYASAADHLQKCLDIEPAQPDASIIKKNIGILRKKSGKKKK